MAVLAKSPFKVTHVCSHSVSLLLLLLLLNGGAQAAWETDRSRNQPLCTEGGDQLFPVVVADGQGGAFVIWQDARSGNWDIYAQHLDAQGNSRWVEGGLPVCALPAAQDHPEAVSDGQGGVIVLWSDGRHGNADIYAQRLDGNGEKRWAVEGVPVCVEPALQEDIFLIPDGQGGAIAVWEDWRHGNQDIYAQRIAPDGSMLWGANGVPATLAPGDQYDPVLVSDGEGGGIVLWWDIGTPDWDIYAQRLDAAGKPQWGESGRSVCDVPGNQGAPLAVPDGRGGAIVVWSDYRTDPMGDLYAQRVDPAGQLSWDPQGVPVCTLPQAQQQPTLVSDGRGGAVLTWWDDRDRFSDIYAQRVNAEGQLLWQDGGIPVCVVGGVQREPQIIVAGEAFCIFWRDFREDYAIETVDHLYAQYLTVDGQLLWELEGRPITTAPREQGLPRGAWIGSGVLIAWPDYRNGAESDLYVQWIEVPQKFPE